MAPGPGRACARCVLDAAVFPRVKICAGWVTPGGARRPRGRSRQVPAHHPAVRPAARFGFDGGPATRRAGAGPPATASSAASSTTICSSAPRAAGADVRWGDPGHRGHRAGRPGPRRDRAGRLRGARGDRRGRPSLPGGAGARPGLRARRGRGGPGERDAAAARVGARRLEPFMRRRPSSTSSPTCAATAGTSRSATSSTSASACTRAHDGSLPRRRDALVGEPARLGPAARRARRSSRSRGTPTSCGARRRAAWPARGFCLIGDAAGLARDLSRRGHRARHPERAAGRGGGGGARPRRARRSTATRGRSCARYGPGELGWLGRQLGRAARRASARSWCGPIAGLRRARGVASCSTPSSACGRWPP